MTTTGSWRYFVLAAALLVTACAIPVKRADENGVVYMTRAELRAYAENVFRKQNKALSQLMLLSHQAASRDDNVRWRLMAAEDRLLQACGTLNELAILRRDDRDADMKTRMRVPETVAKCEAEADRTEALIDEFRH